MRLIVVSLGMILVLVASACNEEDSSGSTGISCSGGVTAPLCFSVNNEPRCIEPPSKDWQARTGRTTDPMPSTFEMTISSGEGGYFCTTPGAQGYLTLDSIRGNYNPERPQFGNATLTNTIGCDTVYTFEWDEALASGGYAYKPLNTGLVVYQTFDPTIPAFIFEYYVDTGNKATINLGAALDPDVTAQFCYNTESSGDYKLTASDGSTQEGSWAYGP